MSLMTDKCGMSRSVFIDGSGVSMTHMLFVWVNVMVEDRYMRFMVSLNLRRSTTVFRFDNDMKLYNQCLYFWILDLYQ